MADNAKSLKYGKTNSKVIFLFSFDNSIAFYKYDWNIVIRGIGDQTATVIFQNNTINKTIKQVF